MTIDALLNILLAVGIPAVLAAMGGYLAAKALPAESSSERWIWISAFISLAVLAIALGFFQQMRATTKETVEADRQHQAELRNLGEVKYLQGQQDTTNMLLATIVSSNSLSPQLSDLFKAMITKPAVSTPAHALPELSDAEALRRDAYDMAHKLREMKRQYDEASELAWRESTEQRKGISLTDPSARNQFEAQRVEAGSKLKHEWNAKAQPLQHSASILLYQMRRSVPPDPKYAQGRFWEDPNFAIDNLDKLADYVESMATAIPKDK